MLSCLQWDSPEASYNFARPPVAPFLDELPTGLKLRSLEVAGLPVRLTSGGGYAGVLQSPQHLTKLRMKDCLVLDGEAGLQAALSLLPNLQHVSFDWAYAQNRLVNSTISFNPVVLEDMRQLTFLDVSGMGFKAVSASDAPIVQPLEHLTNLHCLQLSTSDLRSHSIRASMVAGMHQLSRLDLDFQFIVEPDALACLRRVQHLRVCIGEEDESAVVASVRQLQRLTRLTHLSLSIRGEAPEESTAAAAAAAFSTLTASSQLQHLEMRAEGAMPADAWQHILPKGQQLPQLRVLTDGVQVGWFGPWHIPDVTRLVSCCPALRELATMPVLDPQQLALLHNLAGLHQLKVGLADDDNQALEQMSALAQLTSLHGLTLITEKGLNRLTSSADQGLRELTKLQQLKSLDIKTDIWTSHAKLQVRSQV